MLAPIALYPDDLLADVLAAATYPLDVVEAARWLQDPQNAALKGDQLFAALREKSWDPSVKSLALFPRILRMLDANLEWTEQLGEATSPIRPPLWTPSSGFAGGLNRPAGWSRRRKRSCARNRSPRVSKSRLRSRPKSRGRLRPDLRSFIRLRSLALPRFSAVFPRLRWRHYRRVRLDQRPDHRAVRIELSLAAYRDRP